MRKAISFVRLAAIASLVLGFASHTWAVDGATPIWNAGTVIQAQGNYVVSRPIGCGTVGPVLTIETTGVTVDLNGFTLHQCDSSEDNVVINVPFQDANPITLHNGTIWGGLNGIRVFNAAPNIVLRDVTIAETIDTAVVVFSLSTMEAVNVSVEGGARGFHLIGSEVARSSVRFRDVRVRSTTDAAVRLQDVMNLEASGLILADSRYGLDLTGLNFVGSPVRGSMLIGDSIVQADFGIVCFQATCNIYESSIQSCGTAIRLNNAPSSLVSHSVVETTTDCFDNSTIKSSAIWITGSDGSTIDDSIVQGSSDPGADAARHGVFIDGSDEVKVTNSVIRAHGDDGINISGSARHDYVEYTSSTFNGRHGFYTDGIGSVFDNNKAGNNGQDGLHLATAGHVFRGNILVGNGSPTGGAGLVDAIDGGGNIE